MTIVTQFLSYLQPNIRDYLLWGAAAIKGELFYSKDCSEITDTNIAAYTKEQWIIVQKSIMNPKLEGRVIPSGDEFVIDGIRTIEIKDLQKKQAALAAWTPLRNYFW